MEREDEVLLARMRTAALFAVNGLGFVFAHAVCRKFRTPARTIEAHPAFPLSHGLAFVQELVAIGVLVAGAVPADFAFAALFRVRRLDADVDEAGDTRGRVRGVDGVGGDRGAVSDRESDQKDEATDDAVSGHRNLLWWLVDEMLSLTL